VSQHDTTEGRAGNGAAPPADCRLPCDDDCEIGRRHCENWHRPNHKPDWHDPEACDRNCRPPLTEAEYAATLPGRMNAVAAELNERLADVLPDGMRFEWR
jgi:hypothetical protein